MIEEHLIKPEFLVYDNEPVTMTQTPLHYCPGCTHGVVHKVIMEVVRDLGIQEETIGVAPVGCSVFAYHYMTVDMQEAAHGRAIGTAETIHTVNRGENIMVVFINNAIYGMTGGQMAPTTLLGMKTATSPYGRDAAVMGSPIKITELIANLPGAYFVTRQAAHTPNAVRRLAKAIKNGFEFQKLNRGTSFIEVVSNCPSGWKMTPVQANEWMEANMFPVFPLGDIKVPDPKTGDPVLVKKN